jgi:hypothetical protein
MPIPASSFHVSGWMACPSLLMAGFASQARPALKMSQRNDSMPTSSLFLSRDSFLNHTTRLYPQQHPLLLSSPLLVSPIPP